MVRTYSSGVDAVFAEIGVAVEIVEISDAFLSFVSSYMPAGVVYVES